MIQHPSEVFFFNERRNLASDNEEEVVNEICGEIAVETVYQESKSRNQEKWVQNSTR